MKSSTHLGLQVMRSRDEAEGRPLAGAVRSASELAAYGEAARQAEREI